jgi:hypothetical protein
LVSQRAAFVISRASSFTTGTSSFNVSKTTAFFITIHHWTSIKAIQSVLTYSRSHNLVYLVNEVDRRGHEAQGYTKKITNNF